LGELYSKCVQMVNENKISAKNAFDLPLIDHMDDIVDSFMGGRKRKTSAGGMSRASSSRASSGALNQGDVEAEHRFHEASCTIEASARIYACRVDCVHTDTYRVLGGLSSADMADEEEGKEGEKASAKKRRICGVNTLERNEANIIQQNIETDEQSDPMFRRMAAAFDAGGAKGLLLSHLPVAEDLSLVFNGDVPLTRAAQTAKPLFERREEVPADTLGLGDASTARARIMVSRLCPPELDTFRRHLWGPINVSISLPAQLEALLGPQGPAGGTSPAVGHTPATLAVSAPGPHVPMMPPLANGEEGGGSADEAATDADPLGPPELAAELPLAVPHGEPQSLVPLEDVQVPQAPADVPAPNEDVIAFDELFEKFCGGAGTHQFAYFDDCWKRLPPERDAKQQGAAALPDSEGSLAAVPEAHEVKEKPSKRPLFDLSNLDKPLKPIETEPVHKHQLSARAVHWQLHKDVPPYMIDRITMPSWQTWSKSDFACLGLRPHLMLKLVRKTPPLGDGPHGFSDLFSTVVVENPEAFPWFSGIPKASSHDRRDDGQDDAQGYRDADLVDEAVDEDVDAKGLPAHLDVDPQELFLRPDDRVVPGLDQGDFPDDLQAGADECREGGSADGEDGSFMPGIDFDLADRPQTVGSTDIAYSRNSKFVDVKLVKHHLWDCISEDVEAARPHQAKSSFQGLVDRTIERLPKAETENLSAAVCFICALHLCNEKGLELAPEASRPLGDFTVLGPQ